MNRFAIIISDGVYHQEKNTKRNSCFCHLQVVTGVPLLSHRSKRDAEHNLRIHLVYEESISKLPADEQDLIKVSHLPRQRTVFTVTPETLKISYLFSVSKDPSVSSYVYKVM